MFWGCGRCSTRWHRDSPVCPSCLGPAERTPAPNLGNVIEYSYKDGQGFCAVDFDGVLLLCSVASGEPSPGAVAKLTGNGLEVDIEPNPNDTVMEERR